jgi:hypothetical protein
MKQTSRASTPPSASSSASGDGPGGRCGEVSPRRETGIREGICQPDLPTVKPAGSRDAARPPCTLRLPSASPDSPSSSVIRQRPAGYGTGVAISIHIRSIGPTGPEARTVRHRLRTKAPYRGPGGRYDDSAARCRDHRERRAGAILAKGGQAAPAAEKGNPGHQRARCGRIGVGRAYDPHGGR